MDFVHLLVYERHNIIQRDFRENLSGENPSYGVENSAINLVTCALVAARNVSRSS
jgi:hypothetical protein